MKRRLGFGKVAAELSRPRGSTRGLKLICKAVIFVYNVASSREYAWIETPSWVRQSRGGVVASSREYAWIETGHPPMSPARFSSRPRGRTRGLKPPGGYYFASFTSRVLAGVRVD